MKKMKTMANRNREILKKQDELFLQAFEKPTQIYRYLRIRHDFSPIFLYRTISYMKDGMWRNHKKRSSFELDSILGSVFKEEESDFLNLMFSGFIDKSADSDKWWNAGDAVCVETSLYKIVETRESTFDYIELWTKSANTIYNPHEDICELSTISIPTRELMQHVGETHVSYKVLFRIQAPQKFEPIERKNYSHKDLTFFGFDLVVYDKISGVVPMGQYELGLGGVNPSWSQLSSPKTRSWELFPNCSQLSKKSDAFEKFPIVRFYLTWSSTEIPSSIPAKNLTQYCPFVNSAASRNLNDATASESKISNNNGKSSSRDGAENIQVVYSFLYSNNTRQRTVYAEKMICPWCKLDCLRLYVLLKHLKLCHPHFNCTYKPVGNDSIIEVTINDACDDFHSGSYYDLDDPSGSSFARTFGPKRRNSTTILLACRPRRQTACLDEFVVDDLSNQRPYTPGHNRLYHHSQTGLPIHPKEFDIDSEGERDPCWIRKKTVQMIDAFSDVNTSEKKLMNMWNLHCIKHNFFGDCYLPLAVDMFLDAKGQEIIQNKLCGNFILHMSCLFDCGLVSPETVQKSVLKLQGIFSQNKEACDMLHDDRTAQLKYWRETGVHKQEK